MSSPLFDEGPAAHVHSPVVPELDDELVEDVLLPLDDDDDALLEVALLEPALLVDNAPLVEDALLDDDALVEDALVVEAALLDEAVLLDDALLVVVDDATLLELEDVALFEDEDAEEEALVVEALAVDVLALDPPVLVDVFELDPPAPVEVIELDPPVPPEVLPLDTPPAPEADDAELAAVLAVIAPPAPPPELVVAGPVELAELVLAVADGLAPAPVGAVGLEEQAEPTMNANAVESESRYAVARMVPPGRGWQQSTREVGGDAVKTRGRAAKVRSRHRLFSCMFRERGRRRGAARVIIGPCSA